MSGYFKQRERLLFSQKQFSRLKGILNISETVSVMECVVRKTDQCHLATEAKIKSIRLTILGISKSFFLKCFSITACLRFPWICSPDGAIHIQLICVRNILASLSESNTAPKIKFYIKDFFSKRDQIHWKLRIWSYLLKKSLMWNFIFCAVQSRKN